MREYLDLIPIHGLPSDARWRRKRKVRISRGKGTSPHPRDAVAQRTYARQAARAQISLAGRVCEMCGAPALHRHHYDYYRPLDVVAVCELCHWALHAGNLWGDAPRSLNEVRMGLRP